ncbi:hypothetical protein PVAP13_1KG540501 [Panicum virgatum]|uniref:MYB-CC type transcription factor LHEQLE-containing domain-containing protein n=1 Tax=Panicum virgatum TaxID=38727 RepID=A0A8T0XRI7_PANVG|nr:hypothetical protein PVAP13_1KG540501 [Panicum virgatum]
MGTACSHTSTMNRLYNGTVPPCLSSAIIVAQALSEDAMSTCILASNFTSGLHANNKSSDGKLCSGPYVTEPSDPDTRLSSTHSSLLHISRPLMMDFPEVSEQISSNQEQLQGLFDYVASADFPNPQNVTAFGQQVQATMTINPITNVALQNEWFSSRSSMQHHKNTVDAISATRAAPKSYPYCCTQRSTPNPLHERFVDAINKLGGSEKATPKAVQKVMKVEGLTIYHVKSHLQKYRTVQRQPESSNAGVPGRRSSQMDEASTLQLKGTGNVEGLMAQISLQKQLHEQLEIQRKLQLQVEGHSKYLEVIIAKQSESLKKLGAFPGFQDRFLQVLDDNKEREEWTVCTHSAEHR